MTLRSDFWVTFDGICSQLRALVERILADFFSSIDPNWSCAFFDFDVSGQVVRWAWFNGPKYGEVSFANVVEQVLPPVMLQLLRVLAVHHRYFRSGCLRFRNPNYRLEIINGRTKVIFENCRYGVVKNFDPAAGTLEIRMLDEFDDNDVVRQYTVEQLVRELASDACVAQACGIMYCPQPKSYEPSLREVTVDEVQAWLAANQAHRRQVVVVTTA